MPFGSNNTRGSTGGANARRRDADAVLEPEARAYLNRGGVDPSGRFGVAVNTAIAAWKRQGNWSRLLGAWLFCADSPAAALLNITGDAGIDATITGAPTFTPGLGFSGFSTANGVKWPITSAQLLDDDFCSVMAGAMSGSGLSNYFINSDAGAVAAPGHFYVDSDGSVRGGKAGSGAFARPINGDAPVAIGGSRSTFGLFNTSWSGSANSSGGVGRSSNYKTALMNSHPLTRLSAVAQLSSAASVADAVHFTATLNALLADIGAI